MRGGSRVGIYFAETGASQRASTVIYDRAHSAISEMTRSAVNWDAVMAGAAWFHVTGITPALGERRPRRRRRRDRGGAARRRARQRGPQLTARSCGRRRRRRRSMRPLMRDVDVVIANEEDLQSVLGVHVDGDRRHQRRR